VLADGRPLVRLRLGWLRRDARWSPQQARVVARQIEHAADVADLDARRQAARPVDDRA